MSLSGTDLLRNISHPNSGYSIFPEAFFVQREAIIIQLY